MKNFVQSKWTVLSVFVLLIASAIAIGQIGNTRPKATAYKMPEPIDLVKADVEKLKETVGKLKEELKTTQSDLAKTKEQLAGSLRPPKGYTSMMITKANFGQVEDTALMKFWVRY